MQEDIFWATGRRKTSVARIRLKPGSGKIVVNKRDFEDYFDRKTSRLIVKQPLVLTSNDGKFDIFVNVKGGGMSGQAGAVKHGITRALIEYDPDLRGVLKKAGFVRRDPRAKERKKYGQKSARARYQYSKR